MNISHRARLLLVIALVMAGCAGGSGSNSALHRASAEGDIERVKAAVSRGEKLDAPGRLGATALHEAAYCGRHDIVVYLIEHGADPAALDNLSQSPLDYANETIGGRRTCSTARGIDKGAVSALLSSPERISAMRRTGIERGELDKALSSQRPEALRDFVSWKQDSALRPEAESALAGLEEQAWKKSQGNIESLSGFLRRYPSSIHRPDALGMLYKHSHGKRPVLRALAAEFKDITAHMPTEERLWYIGPPGLTVDEISAMLKAGATEQFIVNRIEASGARFEVFTPEESSRLTGMGIPARVQDAMRGATLRASEPAQSAALMAEIESLRSRLPLIVSGDTVELAADCSARLAALEACRDKTSGAPRQNACMSAAKTEFPCPGR